MSLSLRPTVLLGLEVVARHRRESLSKAAEFLIGQGVESYSVDPEQDLWPLMASFLSNWLSRFSSLKLDGIDVMQLPVDERDKAVMKKIAACEKGRLLVMPASLLSAQERYFGATVFRAFAAAEFRYPIAENGAVPLIFMLPIFNELADVAFTICMNLEARGLSTSEAAEPLLEEFEQQSRLMLLIDEKLTDGVSGELL